MPDIGMLEVILIGIIAFLVLGPERMPDILSQVGNAVRHARRWMGEIKQQLHQETQALRSEVDEVKDAVSKRMSMMPDETQLREEKQSRGETKDQDKTEKPDE